MNIKSAREWPLIVSHVAIVAENSGVMTGERAAFVMFTALAEGLNVAYDVARVIVEFCGSDTSIFLDSFDMYKKDIDDHGRSRDPDSP